MEMVITVGTTVGIAAAIVLVGHILEWLLGARRERRLYINVAATALAVMAAQAFLEQTVVPEFPPKNGLLWLYWLAPAVAVLTTIGAVVKKRFVVWTTRFIAAAGGIFIATRPLLEGAWADDGWMRIGVAVVATLALWFGVDRLVERDEEDPSVPLGLAFAAAGGAGAIALVTSIKVGLVPSAIAMGTGATALLMFVKPRVSSRAIVEYFVPMVGIIYTMAHGYADFAALPMLLVGAAPLFVWAVQAARDKSVWIRSAVAVGAALVPVAIATPLAEQALSQPEGEEQQVDEDGTYTPY